MPIVVRLDEQLHARRMTLTELASRVDITLANLSILKTGKAKAIRFSTLEAICSGFGITMAQFFASGNMVELSEEQKQMFDAWSVLTKAQKEALEHLIRVMKTQ